MVFGDQDSSAFVPGAPAGATTRVRFLRAGAFASEVTAACVGALCAEPAASLASPATFVSGALDIGAAARSTACRLTGAPELDAARRRGRFAAAVASCVTTGASA